MFQTLALALGMFFTVAVSYADCTEPAGQEGLMVYNSSFKVMQFCNGTNWISMASTFVSSGERISGEIQAFNLATCPAEWSEYTAARGRVLRGIDSTGSIDPDGTRTAGSTQEDAVQDHTHHITSQSAGTNNVVAFTETNPDNTYASGGNTGSRGDAYFYVGGVKTGRISTETRSKNVAVLYCVKD